MPLRSLSIAAVFVLAAVVVGCGDDDSGGGGQADAPSSTSSTTTVKTTPPPAASHAVTIRMIEYAFDPKDAVAKKGKVTISAPNDGQIVHELVLLKTDADPATLPKKGDEVDESTSVGEIPDVDPGATKKATFKLAPGKYAMVCALPDHYENGMYGSLTVK
jgi:uncharacterized cupredoxin-like copper-binding protein